MAESKIDRTTMRHELRVGWGDMLFERLIWRNPSFFVTTMPESYRQTYQEDYQYSEHLWAEYQWRPNYWFSLGAMVDLSEVGWDNVTRNGLGQEIARDPRGYFYNVSLMPTIRFTYLHHPYVNLYSGLGVGLTINGGTELNARGHATEAGAAIQFTLLGLSANYKRYFAAIDLGGLYALRNTDAIYMASSRMFNASIGVRF